MAKFKVGSIVILRNGHRSFLGRRLIIDHRYEGTYDWSCTFIDDARSVKETQTKQIVANNEDLILFNELSQLEKIIYDIK